jgi:hypothetical protein
MMAYDAAKVDEERQEDEITARTDRLASSDTIGCQKKGY